MYVCVFLNFFGDFLHFMAQEHIRLNLKLAQNNTIHNMRTAFFWVIMQQVVVLHNNPEERRSHLLHSRSLK
jgi:hypothetical protein